MNKKVLITAGPTHEAIDPVRFIGNHSSGKMGYALAEAFAEAGAEVVLVSGPVALSLENDHVKIIRVTSALEMLEACVANISAVDLAVFAAAVADYTPENVALKKIKRKGDEFQIRLKPTSDIAAEMGKQKLPGQFFVGFALETDNALENAKKKLVKKNLDMIVLNSLEDPGAGFATETNKVTMVEKSGRINKFDLKLKKEVARDIVRMTLKLSEDA